MELSAVNLGAVTSEEALKDAALCLQEYLRLHGTPGRPYDVLAYMASATLSNIELGKRPKFKNLELQQNVLGKMGDDSSAWLSPIWKKLSGDILPSLEESLEGFAKAKGYDFYPGIGKTDSGGGSGNAALYFLIARNVNAENAPDKITLKNADIYYLPAVKITPSWWAKWLFNKNYSAFGWRKLLYVWTPLVWFLILVALAFLLWILLSRDKAPLSPHDVISLSILFGIFIYCPRFIRGYSAILDDRITIAPEYLVGFDEHGVCIELNKENLNDKLSPRVLRLVKYLAECPICGAEVLLDKGEPDFPRRLIGRCQESPREHIFSFDRITKAGMKLRGG